MVPARWCLARWMDEISGAVPYRSPAGVKLVLVLFDYAHSCSVSFTLTRHLLVC